jgi:peptide methionine sulfoxide reductase msrA/msrB
MAASSIVRRAALIACSLVALACRQAVAEGAAAPAPRPASGEKVMKNPSVASDAKSGAVQPAADSGQRETAILAGGCFWGVEELLRKLPGVVHIEVGYTGGTTRNPDYEQVHAGIGGHAEAVEIVFDPARTTYEDLLLFFFKMHDPTTRNRQGNDIGVSYRSAIFYTSDEQRRVAEAVKARVDASGAWKRPVVTEITKASEFWPAEAYHQDYLQKNPGGYTCHFVRDIAF